MEVTAKASAEHMEVSEMLDLLLETNKRFWSKERKWTHEEKMPKN